MKLGIVGHEAAKFTETAKGGTLDFLHGFVAMCQPELIISGGCHLGGVDIWAEEVAKRQNIPFRAYLPKEQSWEAGYKHRNLQIAENSDVVLCVVVDHLPYGYSGMRFDFCYHCKTADHVKSGGCWTAKRAKQGVWYIADNIRGYVKAAEHLGHGDYTA